MTTSSFSDVSSVVVTYNNAPEITDALRSLHDAGCDQIVVVDNHSNDNTVTVVSSSFPKVNLVQNPSNLGYGTAVNLGVNQCNTKYVLITNADVVLASDTIALLRDVLESDHRAAVAAPTITNTDGSRYPSPRVFPTTIDAVGHGLVGVVRPHNKWSTNYQLFDQTFTENTPVDWVSGSCFLIRVSAFAEISGFNEHYFMYMEDVDLCRRLHDVGWSVVFVPQATVVHARARSSAQRPVRAIVAHHRSLIRYVNDATSGASRALLPVLWLGIVGRGCVLSMRALSQRFRRQS